MSTPKSKEPEPAKETYIFSPKKDITAYELLTIYSKFGTIKPGDKCSGSHETWDSLYPFGGIQHFKDTKDI